MTIKGESAVDESKQKTKVLRRGEEAITPIVTEVIVDMAPIAEPPDEAPPVDDTPTTLPTADEYEERARSDAEAIARADAAALVQGADDRAHAKRVAVLLEVAEMAERRRLLSIQLAGLVAQVAALTVEVDALTVEDNALWQSSIEKLQSLASA